jgi:hypothetical protein
MLFYFAFCGANENAFGFIMLWLFDFAFNFALHFDFCIKKQNQMHMSLILSRIAL